MPDTKPQYGLPYQRLPGTQRDMTPESILNEQIQSGRQQIQNKYALQWKEINRSRRFIGTGKAQRMLREIDVKAKQEMLQFNQQAQQQLVQLQNIDRLVQVGGLTEQQGVKLKAQETFGRDTAERMYPEPKRERTIPQQFSELDVYSHRISQELERFQIVGGKPSKLPLTYALAGPLMGGALAAYHGLKGRKRKEELQIWDPTISIKVKGEDVMGDWRTAEPEEVGIYKAWLQEEKDVAARKRELLGQPDITRRKAGIAKSGFDAGVTKSITPQRAPTITKPRVIRQRNTRTGQMRISYDGGKSWQTSG